MRSSQLTPACRHFNKRTVRVTDLCVTRALADGLHGLLQHAPLLGPAAHRRHVVRDVTRAVQHLKTRMPRDCDDCDDKEEEQQG
jgi:hypothetical protein